MISVILPIYRNASTMQELVARLFATLAGQEVEILVAIDASPDNSAEVAREISARDPRVKVIELVENVGQNRAILVGLEHAAGDIAVVMDADLQDAPENITVLLDYLDAHAGKQVVFAQRSNRYSRLARHITGRSFKTAMRLLSGFRIPKNAGLFVAMRRELYRKLPAARDHRIHVISLIARAAKSGGIAAIPLPRNAAVQTGYTGAMRANLAWNAFRTLAGFPARAAKPARVRGETSTSPQECVGSNIFADPQIPTLVLAAVCALALRILIAIFSGWSTADEAWMLQVIYRTAHGDVLYRDVFYGTLPLPIYVGRAFCFFFGYSAITFKIACAAVDVSIFVATQRFLKALG